MNLGGDLWIHSQWLQSDYLLLPVSGICVWGLTCKGGYTFHFQSLMMLMRTSPQPRPERLPGVAPSRGCGKNFFSKDVRLCKLISNCSESSQLEGKGEFCHRTSVCGWALDKSWYIDKLRVFSLNLFCMFIWWLQPKIAANLQYLLWLGSDCWSKYMCKIGTWPASPSTQLQQAQHSFIPASVARDLSHSTWCLWEPVYWL